VRLLAIMVVAWLLAAPARASVRVEEDEVIFTLRMPSATEVFLVGDFNQWNPTVEPMNRVDDHFEVGLFLVAGEYHYQFVVDGKWITDPDNPAPRGAPKGGPGGATRGGSPLLLIERGNGLVLSTEIVSKTAPPPHARPGARYIGAMRTRDGTDVTQRVDFTVAGRFDPVRAHAAVATDDTSWAWSSGPSIDVWFDRARVDVDLGKLLVSGFENDSTWVSDDPTALVGNAGIYHYDAGLHRHGATATLSGAHVAVRALYADQTTRAPAPPASIASAPDSGAVYDTRYSFDGSDAFATEAVLDFGDAGAGLVFRREDGFNPGVVAQFNPSPSLDRVLATRENRAVSSAWVRDRVGGLNLSGTYGWGSVKTHAFGTAEQVIPPGAVVDASVATEPVDQTFPVMDTQRGLVEVGAGSPAHLHGAARWDFSRFDFDGVRGRSRADVHRVTVSAADSLLGWSLDARLQYTNADYGDAPDALTIDWPELNPWLSIWDQYDEAAIVGIAYDRYNATTVSAGRAWPRVAARVDVTAGLRGVADALVHASARGHADATVHGPWQAGADVRVAWYDAAGGSSNGALWSGYLEGRYRRGPFELSAGYGFDPLVFNPVTAEYDDIGYTEFLRGTLANGVARSRGDQIVRALIEKERLLEDAGVFKIELVVDLR
jgi:Glycogen recognition site of AMP-activated protein kinase